MNLDVILKSQKIKIFVEIQKLKLVKVKLKSLLISCFGFIYVNNILKSNCTLGLSYFHFKLSKMMIFVWFFTTVYIVFVLKSFVNCHSFL